jgi:hypothetical protein
MNLLDTFQKGVDTIQNSETVTRLKSESSPYFKPFQKIGGGLLILGIAIKVVAIFTPAMPVALVSLAPEIIAIGGTMFTGAALTRKR